LYKGHIKEYNGEYHINNGYIDNILIVPASKTSISVKIDYFGRPAMLVRYSDGKDIIEKSIVINMKYFDDTLNNSYGSIGIRNIGSLLGSREDVNQSYQFGWEEVFNGFSSYVGFKGYVSHNELYWIQKNGKLKFRRPTKKNYL